MSRRYTSDGKRISSQTHAKRSWTCSCGKVVRGNGGKSSHRKVCDGHYLTWDQAYNQRKAAMEAAATEEEDRA